MKIPLEEGYILRTIPAPIMEITTPYLDHHNDYIQIYLVSELGSHTLSDDGYTVDEMETSGISMEEIDSKIKEFSEIKEISGVLYIRGVNEDNYIEKKAYFMNAILTLLDINKNKGKENV